MSTSQLVNAITSNILNPLLALIFAVGLLVFMWGVVEFIIGMNVYDGDKKESGKQHMLWGIIGMFIMVTAWAILGFVAQSVCGSLSNCTASSTSGSGQPLNILHP